MTTNAALDRRRDGSSELANVAWSIVTKGDISALSPQEQSQYYITLCERLKLDAATQPFALLRLNGKLVMYPTKGATDQLASVWGIDRELVEQPTIIDTGAGKIIRAVCRATWRGRVDTSTGTVPVPNGGGEALCNALLKAETKAKRRATLSILGLGMLDETEVDSIPDSAKSEALPIKVEAAKPSRSRLSDEEKAERVAAILDEYRAALARGESADAAFDAAKKRGGAEGVATLVQAALQREISETAAKKRAEYDAQQTTYSRLVSELDSAETSAAVIAVWTDNAAAIKQLPEQHRRQAWSETVARWSAVGGEGKGQGLRDALNERGES